MQERHAVQFCHEAAELRPFPDLLETGGCLTATAINGDDDGDVDDDGDDDGAC